MQKNEKEFNLHAERIIEEKQKRDKNVNAVGEKKIEKVERNRKRNRRPNPTETVTGKA